MKRRLNARATTRATTSAPTPGAARVTAEAGPTAVDRMAGATPMRAGVRAAEVEPAVVSDEPWLPRAPKAVGVSRAVGGVLPLCVPRVMCGPWARCVSRAVGGVLPLGVLQALRGPWVRCVPRAVGRAIAQIDEDGAQPGDLSRFCQWQQDGGQLALFLARTTDADFTAQVAEAKPVDGVGEDAFELSGHLYVLYGTVQIDVYSRGASDAQNLTDAKEVAKVVMPRI